MVLRSVCVCICVAVAVGCGGGEEKEKQETPKPSAIEATVLEYFATQNDSKRRCQLLSASTRERYGGGPNGPGCVKQFKGSGNKPPKVAIRETAQAGGKACARFEALPNGGESVAALVKEGSWKIDHFETAFEPRSALTRRCREDVGSEPE